MLLSTCRDDVLCGIELPAVKQNKKSPPKTCYSLPFVRCRHPSELRFRPMLHPSKGELLNWCIPFWVSLTTRQHNERKNGIGSGDQPPIVVFLLLDCVGEMFHSFACYIIQIRAEQELTMGISSRSALFLHWRWRLKSSPPPL